MAASKKPAKGDAIYVGDVWVIPDAPFLCTVKTPSDPGTFVSGGSFVVTEPGEHEAWNTEGETFAKATVLPTDERPAADENTES